MVATLFACASALLTAAAVQLHGGLEEAKMDQPYWMRLKNLGDVQYTGLMRIGGQQMKAIVDTGSFELVVFGKNCTVCGSSSNLYDGSKSPNYVSHGFPGTHSYGSGTTYSVEAHDKVQIGALHIPTQVFWEVTDADMPILSEDSFQVIMGVGPPSSVINFAKQELDEVHKELKEYKASGQKVTSKVRAIVEHYEDEVVHAANTTTIAENVGVENMAVCMGRNSGSDGYYIWNDRRLLEKPNKFVELDVIGDIYWSANMTGVQLGQAALGENASKAMKKAAKGKEIGCAVESCSAVIDTGTSLIVAPTKMAEEVFEAMQQWVEAGGTCDDLSKLPSLKFMLNGHPFILPPEAYIGSMDGSLDADMKGFMPHLYQEHRRKLYDTVGCQPLIMTMDADSQFGPLWIIGMPFFREYYTNFKFVKHIGKLSVPQATTMAFSKADSRCRPSKMPDDDSEDSNSMLLAKASTRRNVQLRVDATKIRISSLAQRVQSQKGLSMINKPTVRI